MSIYRYFILIFALLFSSTSFSKTLNIYIVDGQNKTSLSRYLKSDNFSKKQLKKVNKFIFIDSKTGEAILKDVKLVSGATKKDLIQKTLSRISKFHAFSKQNQGSMKLIMQIRDSENDVAAILKILSEGFLRIYYKDYDDINIIFFGNSLLHNAYGHDFKKGYPSDGFLSLESSEFNQVDKYNYSNAKFHFFYDDEPRFSKKILRFYTKLLKSHFNSEVVSYNEQYTLKNKPEVLALLDDFYANKLKILTEKLDSDCQAVDILNVNSFDADSKLEVTITNKCRINTVVTFKYDEKVINLMMDDSGKVKHIFHLHEGENLIAYQQVNNKWATIPIKTISARSDFIEVQPDWSTNTAVILGKNPLRQDATQVEILHKNSGSVKYAEVKKGEYAIPFQISSGKNVFKVKQLNGKWEEIYLTQTKECQDVLIDNKKEAEDTTVLKMELKNKCRIDNDVVVFIYDKKEYLAVVKSGAAKTDILLNYPVNEIFYESYDGNTVKHDEFIINDFDDVVRLSIDYIDNLLAIINIFEPNVLVDIPIGGINYNDESTFIDGHIHSNLIKSSQGGMIILFEAPSENDYLSKTLKRNYQQVYFVRKKNIPTKGSLYFFVDYFSRHGTYGVIAPLCWNRSQGGLVINYEILNKGKKETGEVFLDPSKCVADKDGNPIPREEDLFLKLIKKIEIK